MYDLVKDSGDIADMNTWLAFEDRDDYDPIENDWITVNRHGHHRVETSLGTVKQGFRIHCFLVDEDDLDTVLNADPLGAIPDFDFSPMTYGWSRSEGDYWEEDLIREIQDVEVNRFVMDFRKEAPLIDTGFVEYHDLIEREKRNFATYDTDEIVARFPTEKWEYLSSQSNHWGLKDTIRSLEVRGEFLKDYLEERDCVLVLAYYQSRDVKETNEEISLPDNDRTTFTIRGGRAERGVRRGQPGCELHWFCPIRVSDIPYSRKEQLMDDRRNLKFQTKQRYRFSKKEAVNEERFGEVGFRRPAIGADSLEESLSFFGWTFFEPEVLEKYKNDGRGKVSEWSRQGLLIQWLDKMHLRAYRNSEDRILIIIDDLADIPDEELSHWYHYNTSHAGEIPEEMVANYIEANFVESESPANAVINAVTELDEAFITKYGVGLYRATGDGIDAERMLDLPRNERRDLLNVMSNVHQAVVENLDKGSLEAQLPDSVVEEDVEGKKSAFFEFIRKISDMNTAVRILEPINAVHDFRKERSHRTVHSGGWPRAVESLGYEEDSDAYRDMYRDAMRETAAALREIVDIVEST